MGPPLITPQLLSVIKHICTSLVPRSYESLAERLVFPIHGVWRLFSDFKALACPGGLVSVDPVIATQKSNQNNKQPHKNLGATIQPGIVVTSCELPTAALSCAAVAKKCHMIPQDTESLQRFLVIQVIWYI